jgi:hypothetical protein
MHLNPSNDGSEWTVTVDGISFDVSGRVLSEPTLFASAVENMIGYVPECPGLRDRDLQKWRQFMAERARAAGYGVSGPLNSGEATYAVR